MISIRRVAAMACCAGLAVGLAGFQGQLGAGPDPRRDSASVRQAADPVRPGGEPTNGLTNQVAAPVPTLEEQRTRMAAAQDLLSARVAALKAERKSAWMATVDIPDSTFGRRQSVAFDNLLTLPLGQFSYGPVHPASALGAARAAQVGPKAWVATVAGSYSLAGFDRAPRSFDAAYTLVERPGGWRIADDTDVVTASQMWDLPGLRVVRGRSGIVIGNAPASRMRDYSATVDTAVRRVTGVWGADWNADVVVLTPLTTEEFAKLLSSADGKGLDQVAAVTQGVIVLGQRAQGDQIVINPKAFAALQPKGRRVVITHELTHVAARSSTTSPVPIWLSEGMADYVAYSGLGLPRTRVASQLLTLVREGKGPSALPTGADFDPSRGTIAPSYAGSWLAVSRLVDLFGRARVVAFYRVIAGGRKVDETGSSEPGARTARAFTQSFRVTQAQFVEGWKGYLHTLAKQRG